MAMMYCGTFQGMMPAATPTGARRTSTGPITPARSSSKGNDSHSSANPSRTMVEANTWPISENDAGDPISVVIVSANSCDRAWMPCDSARIMSARSLGVVCGHGPSSNALRAASTARSMSPSAPSGTTPTTSSVAGLITSMVLPLAGATHSPPMNRTSRFSTRASIAFLKPVSVYGGAWQGGPVGTDAAGIVGHLAHPDRRRVLAALILGASTTDDVKRMTGLGTRAVVTALTRLVENDLVLHDEDGRYWLVEESFRQAVIDAQAAPQPDEHEGVSSDAARDRKSV